MKIYNKDGQEFQIVSQVHARFGCRGAYLCYTVKNMATGEISNLCAQESRQIELSMLTH